MTTIIQSKNIEKIEKIGKKTEDYNIDNYKESIDFNLKHTTLKEMVKQILKQDIKARKDYFWLCLLIWIKSDAIKFIIPLNDFDKMYKPESITRVARELFIEAKKGNKELQFLLNDTETLNKRSDLELLNHNYYQNKKLENRSMILK